MLCWFIHVILILYVKTSQWTFDRILLWIIWTLPTCQSFTCNFPPILNRELEGNVLHVTGLLTVSPAHRKNKYFKIKANMHLMCLFCFWNPHFFIKTHKSVYYLSQKCIFMRFYKICKVSKCSQVPSSMKGKYLYGGKARELSFIIIQSEETHTKK